LREDLRRIGIALPAREARGLGDAQLSVRVVENLRETFRDDPPRTLIDVGAARGSFSLAARLALPDLRAYAFEPLPDEFAVLRTIPGIHAFRFALGDETGPSTIHVSGNPGSSSLRPMLPEHEARFPGTATVRTETIEVRTLDDVIATGPIDLVPPVLMKLDVQGFEDRVLAGGRETLARVDALIVEMSVVELYEGQLLEDDLNRLIEDAGFTRTGDFDEIRSPVSGEVVQRDGLFRRVPAGAGR
jgi:FkbM family methyltransferase